MTDADLQALAESLAGPCVMQACNSRYQVAAGLLLGERAPLPCSCGRHERATAILTALSSVREEAQREMQPTPDEDWAVLLGTLAVGDEPPPVRKAAAFLRLYAGRIRRNEQWDTSETMARAYESAARAIELALAEKDAEIEIWREKLAETEVERQAVLKSAIALAVNRDDYKAHFEAADAQRLEFLAERDALQQRLADVEQERDKLKAARRIHELDNHHNAAVCPYCNPTLEADQEARRQLRERVTTLAGTIRAFLGAFDGTGFFRTELAALRAAVSPRGDI